MTKFPVSPAARFPFLLTLAMLYLAYFPNQAIVWSINSFLKVATARGNRASSNNPFLAGIDQNRHHMSPRVGPPQSRWLEDSELDSWQLCTSKSLCITKQQMLQSKVPPTVYFHNNMAYIHNVYVCMKKSFFNFVRLLVLTRFSCDTRYVSV
jgi:hypothetical protein